VPSGAVNANLRSGGQSRFQGGSSCTKQSSTFAQARALCASAGGTFGVGGPDLVQAGAAGALVVWVCNGVPFVDLETATALHSALTTQCRADNGGLGNVVTLGNPLNFTCYDRGGD
jgi:hypothetical protein